MLWLAEVRGQKSGVRSQKSETKFDAWKQNNLSGDEQMFVPTFGEYLVMLILCHKPLQK
ncbi:MULTISPECIES: hypothetical protein [Nostocaceae]|uniref:hypothetical protein n=1 Tax=Nostocaceae TaxID=1162 RepID=UPI001F559852|nr:MULTISPECIES: hypothetical protein [Nostocaceae]